MYTTKITEIGSIVSEFEDEFLLILFGPEATKELRDICIIHEGEPIQGDDIKVNGQLTMGDYVYQIKKVGKDANDNFKQLGHISIYFRESDDDVLPGAIRVEPQIFPALKIGDEIRFT